MNASETKSNEGGGLLPRHRSSEDPGGQLQVDIGNYEIFEGAEKVGEVWVDVDPGQPNNPSCTIEYWCLFRNYVAPSRAQPSTTLQFRYLSGAHTSLRDFQAYARSVTGARYIVSKCQEQAP